MDIKDLKPNASVDSISGEITSVEEPREFTNFRGSGRVANAVLKDDSGEVKLTLWNEQVDQVTIGSKVVIENGWCKEYRGELQVSTGKFGTLKAIE
ncbi:MAG: OB-fold nucleic acid binding domain-containing protein [Methanobacteriota archaeon]